VTFTRAPTSTEDIPLALGTALLGTRPDGRTTRYRTTIVTTLTPNGRSVSGTAPAAAITGGTDDQLRVNLDGDGVRTITLDTRSTAAAIASALQTAVRALTALTLGNQPAYTLFRCDYGVTAPGMFTLRSGTTGPLSTVVVTDAGSNNGTVVLKLGITHGGREAAGMDSLAVPVVGDVVGSVTNIGPNQITQLASPLAGVFAITNPLILANGRNPANDDAYRQDLQAHILALGRGTPDSVRRGAYQARDTTGQFVVLNIQTVYTFGNVTVYVYDGQSTTQGAQTSTLTLVNDELNGRGGEPDGWLPGGVTSVVIPAKLRPVHLTATILVAPETDLVVAQQILTQALTDYLQQRSIGESVSFVGLLVRLQQVQPFLDIEFVVPVEYTLAHDVFVPVGSKAIPGTLTVDVQF
jgi:hypothetical protein